MTDVFTGEMPPVESAPTHSSGLEAFPDLEILLAEMRKLASVASQTMNRVMAFELRLRSSIHKIGHATEQQPKSLSAELRPAMTAAEFKDLLTRKEVAKQIGVCTVTLKRMYDEGRFPKPIQLSPRRLRFRRSDVDRWIRGDDDRT
jgi:predicted DNA-binding transcriptional regulator AlpA